MRQSLPRRHTRLPFRRHALAVALAAAGTSALTSLPVLAQTPITKGARDYDLPAASLATTLNRIAVDAALTLSVDPTLVQGKQSHPVRGKFEPESALREALRGTGLELAHTSSGALALQRSLQPEATVLRTMKVNADADTNHVDLPKADGFKASYQRTATKMPLSVRETPQAVSVITRDSLDMRQVQTLGQALELSGATQTSGNGPFAGRPTFGFNYTTIRGLVIDSEYDFRDDGFVSGSYFSDPDLAIYDRIEVVKGPNSVLYGRGSIGGLVNRVRKKPLLDAHSEVEATVGSYDTYRLDVDTTGPINDSKSLLGRFVGAYEDAGSFVRGVKTERTVLAPSIEFDVTERTQLLVQGLYQTDDIIPNTGMPLVPTRYDENGNVARYKAPDISRRQFNGVPNRDSYTWRIKSLQAQLDHEFNDDWFATLRLSKTKYDTPIKVDSYAYGFNSTGDDPETEIVERVGDTYLTPGHYGLERDIWSGEIQLNGRFDIASHEVKVTLGADHSDNDYSRRGIYYTPAGTDSAGNTFNLYDGNFERIDKVVTDEVLPYGGDPISNGVYAQAQISATARLKVLLGARYDHVEVRSFDDGITDGDQTQSDTVTDVTGRIGVTYDVNSNISLYALYAQSFQPISDTDIDGKLLDPETGHVDEIGAKTEWLDGKLAATTAIYRIERNDMPITVQDGPRFYAVPDGNQLSRGFEFELNGRPLPGWDVSFNYNNVDSTYRNDNLLSYGSIANAPHWQLGVFTSYEIQRGALRGLGVGVTRFQTDDRGVSTWQTGTIAGYTRYDLHAFYKGIKDVEINVTVRNVTDEVYIEGADRGSSYAQFGSPAAALLSVKYAIN